MIPVWMGLRVKQGELLMTKTRKIVYYAFFITLATALGVFEAMLPNPFPLPGVKLGLANTITILALYLYGLRDGLAIAALRVLFTSLLVGTFLSVGFYLSLTGAVLSTLVMALCIKAFPVLSVMGVSMAGAVTHNLGQLVMASLLIQTPYIFYDLPVLLLAGIPTGLATGYLACLLLPHLEEKKPHI